MKNAKEMYLLTTESIEEMRNNAEEVLELEEEFLDKVMMEAAEAGLYEAEYWWGLSWFEENHLDRDTFADAVEELLRKAGFNPIQIKYSDNNLNGWTGLKVEWSWEAANG